MSKKSNVKDKDNDNAKDDDIADEKEDDFHTLCWNTLSTYFRENPQYLVAHHIDSVNQFYEDTIFRIFKDNNPIRFRERNERGDAAEQASSASSDKKMECLLYLGGKSGRNVYFGKPVIYDSQVADSTGSYVHYMYPNEARLRNFTYGLTIHYDVDVEYIYYDDAGKESRETVTLPKIYLGKFPIMLQSNMCILHGVAREVKYAMGECYNDFGGYFLISGKEKVLVCQEAFADNMMYVRKYKPGQLYTYSCEVRSVSEDMSKPIRYTAVRMLAPTAKWTNGQLLVDVPNVRLPVPLFILFRALGITSDYEIIRHCLLDMGTESTAVMELFRPSIHDAREIFTQEMAIEFIASLTKHRTVASVMDILTNYFLPHVGERNFGDKAYYVGHMVYKLLEVAQEKAEPTNRDSYKFKRVELSGKLLGELFREYYLIQCRTIALNIDREYYFHTGKYRASMAAFTGLVTDNISVIFKERVVEAGLKKGFKGNWGAQAETKRIGVIQDLNRLSWFTAMCQLRKINLPMDASVKIVGPHLLHGTQWRVIDPVDTPDGGSIGLQKHMAISAKVSGGYSAQPLLAWLRENTPMLLLQECPTQLMAVFTKVFVNGNWVGMIGEPLKNIEFFRLFRRNGVIPVQTSITFSIPENTIYIYTDGGRIMSPVFICERGADNTTTNKLIISKRREDIFAWNFTWSELVCGFLKKNDDLADFKRSESAFLSSRIYKLNEIYPSIGESTENLAQLVSKLRKNSAVIEYLDTAEEEGTKIAMFPKELRHSSAMTHCEIHPSLLFGIMGNSIIFPEFNQFPRDLFSCGQSRQAVSLYHTNYQSRIDKMGVVLVNGETPLIKSKYLKFINHEEHPYGINAIVAIGSYTGYNVEDAILINKASVERGIFHKMYYSMYEAHESSDKIKGSLVRSYFTNIERHENVAKLKVGFDYSQLNEYGLVKENTPVTDRTILIGQVQAIPGSALVNDESTAPKKGQLGFVDKAFISEGEEGMRIAKIRIREERFPDIGDKYASRAGQKGTLGFKVPEEDMPYLEDGTRPDMIINPHAIPSRMTIGHLIECFLGNLCAHNGVYGDCTAFEMEGCNEHTIGEALSKIGFTSTGTKIMYAGFTGKQMDAQMFVGPTYYMSLKHMVKDKINYRAKGPNTVLTRQPVQGRANDGGLRFGEMERDSLLGHGIMEFIMDSFLARSDEYYIAVCNVSGMIAIYNPDHKLFLSPMADGPLKFHETVDGKLVLDTVSQFGRSFSILRVPYAFKLLMQELATMGVSLRVITDANVEQMANLSFQSQNIDKLLQVTADKDQLATVINEYKQSITRRLRKPAAAAAIVQPSIGEFPSEESPAYAPVSAPESPQFRPESPAFVPVAPGSPAYAPASPPYAPSNSPAAAPQSPPYASSNSPAEAPGSPAQAPTTSPPYAPNSPAQTPNSAPGSPAYAPISGGGIFGNNALLNEYFAKLSPERKQYIMKHSPEDQIKIMQQIMANLQHGGMAPLTNQQPKTKDELTNYFEVLPRKAKLVALEESFKHQADDFHSQAVSAEENANGKAVKTKIERHLPSDIDKTLLSDVALFQIEKPKEDDDTQSSGDTPSGVKTFKLN